MGTKRKAEAPLEGLRRSGRVKTATAKTPKIVENEAAVRVVEEPVTENAVPGNAIAPLVIAVKPKRFRRPRQRKKCGFLIKLPGEIRNRIYRYALLQLEDRDITSKGPGEPTLLRVCKRVRNETLSIYYAETQFQLIITDYDGAAFQPFMRQYYGYEHLVKDNKGSGTNIGMTMSGAANWNNLVAWIKTNKYDYDLKPTPLEDSLGHCMRFCDAAFILVEHMLWATWEKTEGALNAMRLSHKGTPSPWAEDYDEESW